MRPVVVIATAAVVLFVSGYLLLISKRKDFDLSRGSTVASNLETLCLWEVAAWMDRRHSGQLIISKEVDEKYEELVRKAPVDEKPFLDIQILLKERAPDLYDTCVQITKKLMQECQDRLADDESLKICLQARRRRFEILRRHNHAAMNSPEREEILKDAKWLSSP